MPEGLGTLEHRSDFFKGFHLGGDIMLAQFAWAPSFKRPSRARRIGDKAYAVLDIGVAVRLA